MPYDPTNTLHQEGLKELWDLAFPGGGEKGQAILALGLHTETSRLCCFNCVEYGQGAPAQNLLLCSVQLPTLLVHATSFQECSELLSTAAQHASTAPLTLYRFPNVVPLS